MLGFSSGLATSSSNFGSVPTNFIMDNVQCDGTEQSLFQCTHLTSHNCGSGEGAGVRCVSVTLEGGSSSNEGNLFLNGQPVCDDIWDNNDAIVACRMLGFSSGLATSSSNFGSVPTNFIMDNVQCDGTEQSLFQCTHLTSHNCGSGEGAGVRCVSVTLEGGSSSNEGNLFLNGQPVCDDHWDNNDAIVACRMLGFSSGVATSSSNFGSVSTNFIMDDVRCAGTELSLFQCTHSTSHNCGSTEGAGVRCSGTRMEGRDNLEEGKNGKDIQTTGEDKNGTKHQLPKEEEFLNTTDMA